MDNTNPNKRIHTKQQPSCKLVLERTSKIIENKHSNYCKRQKKLKNLNLCPNITDIFKLKQGVLRLTFKDTADSYSYFLLRVLMADGSQIVINWSLILPIRTFLLRISSQNVIKCYRSKTFISVNYIKLRSLGWNTWIRATIRFQI